MHEYRHELTQPNKIFTFPFFILKLPCADTGGFRIIFRNRWILTDYFSASSSRNERFWWVLTEQYSELIQTQREIRDSKRCGFYQFCEKILNMSIRIRKPVHYFEILL